MAARVSDGKSASARGQGKPTPVFGPRLPWVIGIVLLLSTATVFLPSIHNEFVDYDDSDYVTSNPQVQKGLASSSLIWALGSGHASNWHPLTWISHSLDWEFYGDQPAGHHFTSVLLHAVNALLCFLVLRALTGTTWRSATVAAIFALHPLRVESVAWVSERKDVLSGLFFFLTLLAYTTYARIRTRGSGTPGRPWTWYLLALVFFALGLMSKPMLVTVPFLLLLLDWWPLKRIDHHWSDLKSSLPDKMPFLALTVASSIVTFLVQREGGAVSAAIPLGARLANGTVAYVRYIGKFFWPTDLAVLYRHPGQWPVSSVITCAVVLGLVTVAALLFARKRRYLLTGWFWFLGMMVPVIGVVQVGLQSMADRYTYLPMIGLSIALIWGISDLVGSRSGRRPALAFAVAAAVLVLSVLCVKQIGYWENTETLFGRAVRVTTGNYLAYNNLGYYLSKKGRLEEAIQCYEASLKINPHYEDALNNMGHALATRRKHAEAIPYYEAALRTKPRHVEVHNNLGNALSEIGRADEAIDHYKFVLEQKPEHADAHNNLGIALAMQGKLPEAISHFREAIRIRPSYASARSNLGNAYAVQGQLDQALEQYLECLRYDPKDAQAYNNMGNVLVQKGSLDRAVQAYEQALARKDYNPEAHYNLAIVMLRQGKPERALKHLEDALRQKPNYPEARKQIEALTNRVVAP